MAGLASQIVQRRYQDRHGKKAVEVNATPAQEPYRFGGHKLDCALVLFRGRRCDCKRKEERS